MADSKLEAMHEKAKEKHEEVAKEKQADVVGVETEKPKAPVKKKIEVKKPVVTEATASANFITISYKMAREVFEAIKGKPVNKANNILDLVIALKRPIPFKRYNKKVPHKKGEGFGPGRYPQKVSKKVKELLTNAVANAQYLNLDSDNLYVKSAWSSRAVPQARGGRYTNMKITVAEIKEESKKPKVKK